MLHKGTSLYKPDRTHDLLKLKTSHDAEAEVIGYSPGKGKYVGQVGALLMKMPNGLEFKLGSGLSDYLRKNPPPIGSIVTYRYNGFTKRGIPRFARYLRMREII